MTLLFQPQQTLLFIGDSITDCDRRQRHHAPYGQGYVRIIYDWLTACYSDYQLQIINRGISGDTSRDLKKRWHNDVIVQQPDWLFLKIGINDVWRLLEGRLADAVVPQEFAANVRRCLDWTRQETASQIVLVEPFLVEPKAIDPFRQKLAEYQTALVAISQQYALPLVPLQSAFDAAGQHIPADKWAGDRVHPTQIGHTLIAATILRHCGFNWQFLDGVD